LASVLCNRRFAGCLQAVTAFAVLMYMGSRTWRLEDGRESTLGFILIMLLLAFGIASLKNLHLGGYYCYTPSLKLVLKSWRTKCMATGLLLLVLTYIFTDIGLRIGIDKSGLATPVGIAIILTWIAGGFLMAVAMR